MCRDTILERKGPGSIPLYSMAPLYDSVIAGLAVGQLARVVLESLGLKRGLLSLVRIERQLVRWMEGLLGWVGGVLGLALSLVPAW